MTFVQISYFLEVARCLNITEAAKHLHITQPTLSRQINVMESELNMQLFIRGRNFLRLTPAGALLQTEMEAMMESYHQMLQRAEIASWGISGTLRIGILEGYNVSPVFSSAITWLEAEYPNIKIHMSRHTYSKLLELLYSGKLDVIVSYNFHLADRPNLDTMILETTYPVIAMSKSHALAKQDVVTLADLEQEHFAMVREEECPSGVELVRRAFLDYAGVLPKFYWVDSMEDTVLWVEVGGKCAIFNTGMSAMHNPALKIYELPDLPPMSILLGWQPQNENEALKLFLDYFRKEQQTQRTL